MQEESKAQKLAFFIQEELNKEFEKAHLSKNLINTIKIYQRENGFIIDIPAQRYDFKVFFEKGTIVPYQKGGSYAMQVNKTGGFSRQHQNYIYRSINNAIQHWKAYYKIKAKVSENNVKE